jgi:uncharacterized protein (UPF0335 family)
MNLHTAEPLVEKMEAMEAIARLEAESALLKEHDAEYRRLSAKGGHVRAVVRMVAAHKREYDELMRDARERARTRSGTNVAA